MQIVHKHFPDAKAELVQRCIQLFYQLRQLGLERAPSTRELLNWLKYLNVLDHQEGIAKLEQLDGMGVLVKTEADMVKVKRNLERLRARNQPS